MLATGKKQLPTERTDLLCGSAKVDLQSIETSGGGRTPATVTSKCRAGAGRTYLPRDIHLNTQHNSANGLRPGGSPTVQKRNLTLQNCGDRKRFGSSAVTRCASFGAMNDSWRRPISIRLQASERRSSRFRQRMAAVPGWRQVPPLRKTLKSVCIVTEIPFNSAARRKEDHVPRQGSRRHLYQR